MYKIAAIGDKESVSIFSSVGIDTFYFTNSKEAGERLRTLVDEYAIIFITETLAADLKHITDEYSNALKPAIILIPSVKGSTGDALRIIRESVIKAVGTDVNFDS